MPTETKNVALKRVCSGSISLIAFCENLLSLTTMPARNAPRETLTPARLVRYAVPKQIAITLKRNISGEQTFDIISRSLGMSLRAAIKTTAIIAAALASAMAICAFEPACPPNTGTSKTMGMMARS